MASYLVNKFKDVYRILPNLLYDQTDFARNMDGSIDEDAVYIPCQAKCEIWNYGNGTLTAYIPSIGRGHNLKKYMDKNKIPYTDYDETDEEVTIHFKAKDIDLVAEFMVPRTSGAGISPFSNKNIPRNKEVEIPEEELQRYKDIASKVDKKDILKIRTWNNDFLKDVLQKKIRKVTKDRSYDYNKDMKSMNMGRQVKEFIWSKGFFEDYLNYLDEKIVELYNS